MCINTKSLLSFVIMIFLMKVSEYKAFIQLGTELHAWQQNDHNPQ